MNVVKMLVTSLLIGSVAAVFAQGLLGTQLQTMSYTTMRSTYTSTLLQMTTYTTAFTVTIPRGFGGFYTDYYSIPGPNVGIIMTETTVQQGDGVEVIMTEILTTFPNYGRNYGSPYVMTGFMTLPELRTRTDVKVSEIVSPFTLTTVSFTLEFFLVAMLLTGILLVADSRKKED